MTISIDDPAVLSVPGENGLTEVTSDLGMAAFADAGGAGRAHGNVHFVSKQRVVGAVNGSSAYVLSILGYLKALGYAVHYISPSSTTLGRWAFAILEPEAAVFDSYRIRGTVKLGRLVLRLDPLAHLRSVLAVIDRVLRRLGIPFQFDAPPQYMAAVALTPSELAYLARVRCRPGDLIVCDYAHLTQAIAKMGQTGVPSIVIMHDLVSSRARQFDGLGRSDSVDTMTLTEEMTLLGKADLIVAIQADEAGVVAASLPGHPVVVAPMAVELADQIHPGDDRSILFVGSMAAANIDGLEWFFESVWPRIAAERPGTRVNVVGSVCHRIGPPPPGATYHGVVPDLAKAYRQAGVVISPLRAGSGLKIKLVEAMGWGKAIVATPVTLQGIGPLVGDAVVIREDAPAFASAVSELLSDPSARRQLGTRAREAAARGFARDACYSPIRDFIASRSDTAVS
jgi:succinoglycan biosynthesis protein ExoO